MKGAGSLNILRGKDALTLALVAKISSSELADSSPLAGAPPIDAAWTFGSANRDSITRSSPSSVWTAPSPSQIHPSVSPRLSSLPGLSESLVHQRASFSPSHHVESESSAYYTALWDPSVSPKVPLGRQRHYRSFSKITADGSPSRSKKAQAPNCLGEAQNNNGISKAESDNQSQFFDAQRQLLTGAASAVIEIETRQDFTQSWLQASCTGPTNPEKINWWSDESSVNEKSPLRAFSSGEGSCSQGSWTGDETSYPRQSSSPCSPTFSDWRKETSNHCSKVSSKATSARSSRFGMSQSRSEVLENPLKGDLSLYMHIPKITEANLVTNAALPLSLPRMEEDLPPPPPLGSTAAEENFQSITGNLSSPHLKISRPSISGQASFQRPRKRVSWRGKTCIIALPANGEIRDEATPKNYLSPQDFEYRLDLWKRQGYNVEGFSLSSVSEGPFSWLEGQSRPVYPSSEDEEKERTCKRYRVSIPDRQRWDYYVSRLKEDKLRSLGVSSGEDGSSIQHSPALPFMSRHDSSQSSALLISPPLAASSASALQDTRNFNLCSSQLPVAMNLGAQMIPGGIGTSHHKGKAVAAHIPGYSMAVPSMDKGLPAGYQFSQAQSPLSGTWSPQQYLGSQSESRVTSPPINGLTQSLENVISPIASSSGQDHGNQFSNRTATGMLPQMLHQQAQIQSHLLYQQHQQQQLLLHPQLMQTLINTSNLEDQPKSAENISQPEIANPIPRGHHKNLSKTFQKEVDAAEMRTEELEGLANVRGGQASKLDVEGRCEMAEEPPVLANILQSSIRDITLDNSDLDTNPSISGTPKLQETSSALIPQVHSPNKSVSRMNVNAPEFMYESRSSVPSKAFAFFGNRHVHQLGSTKTAAEPTPAGDPKRTSEILVNNGILNLATQPFTSGDAPKPMSVSREFSFSSSGPSFRLDDPKSEIKSNDLPTFDGVSSSGATVANKIFGDVRYPDFIRPIRKSRAIPIIKPMDVRDISSKADGQEDESGRITQPDGRQKRMRHDDLQGDETPLFATPSSSLLSAPEDPQVFSSNVSSNSKSSHGEKEQNVINVEKATHQLRDMSHEMPNSNVSCPRGDHEPVDAEGKPWEPFSFNDAEDAAIFNAARSIIPSSGKMHPDLTSREQDELSNRQKSFDVKADHDCLLGSLRHHRQDLGWMNSGVIRDVERDSLPVNTEIMGVENLRDMFQVDIGNDPKSPVSPLENLISARSSSTPHSSVSTDHQKGPIKKSSEFVQVAHEGILTPGTETASGLVEGVTYLASSCDEVDTVMKHLKRETMDLQIGQKPNPCKNERLAQNPAADLNKSAGRYDLSASARVRSDAPSPSPNRLRQPFQYLPPSTSGSPSPTEVEMVHRNARFSPSYRPSRTSMGENFPVHRLGNSHDVPASDWDDAISSADELKLQLRAGFFDHRINDLVGGILQERLDPLERTLQTIKENLADLSKNPTSKISRKVVLGKDEGSDADDEDDNSEMSQSRAKSPLRDRTHDKLKNLLELNASRQSTVLSNEMSEILKAVEGLKTILPRPHPSSDDIKTAVADTVARQLRGKSGPIISSHESATVEKLQLQITGLESMLKIADTRADDELKARRATEDALADNQRLLRMAMQEAAEQRESAEETERSLSAFHDERQHGLRRTAMLEGTLESLEKSFSGLTEKNTALEGTLEEYRLSSIQWREEVQETKSENKNLQRTIGALKTEIEDSIRGRQTLRSKFDRLQEDMTLASRDIARDQSRWRKREEKAKLRFEVLNTKFEVETRVREKLESAIETFEAQEKEAANVRHSFERAQREAARLEVQVDEMKSAILQREVEAASYKRELLDARETAKLELQRTCSALNAEIKTANDQANVTSSDLRHVIGQLRAQLDEAVKDAAVCKKKFEIALEEVSTSKFLALQEAAKVSEARFKEQGRLHQEMQAVVEARHAHALQIALEDKKHLGMHLGDKLALSHERVLHLQERSAHLEEKLEISRAAAQAAAQAARTNKMGLNSPAGRASLSMAQNSDIPEKISPQALRESIIVLQEQLQEREGRIEQLEKEQLQIDRDAPTKLKNQEIEINWLRELLGVRIDELEDIIANLSLPSYDRDAVKDAAIRIKTNLQMEQQEKERALTSSPTFSSLTGISALASSPRALPLAAAAAWGNWRKGRDTSVSNSSAFPEGGVSQTPSRSSPSSQSFLSGLLTPPSTKTRQTPQLKQSDRAPKFPSSTSKPPSSVSQKPRQSLSRQDENTNFVSMNPPSTPPLMRQASCDGDGDGDGDAKLTRFVDEDSDANDSDKHAVSRKQEADEPFGADISTLSGETRF